MTTDLHKTIIKRSRLRNKIILVIGIDFLSKRTELSRKNTEKNKTWSANLLKKPPKEHFPNLDLNFISDNKKFWQIVKLLFLNKFKAKKISN